jgi:hypothetical protein
MKLETLKVFDDLKSFLVTVYCSTSIHRNFSQLFNFDGIYVCKLQIYVSILLIEISHCYLWTELNSRWYSLESKQFPAAYRVSLTGW